MKLGVMGFSEGNGHPFSMSAIINGYSDEGFAKSDWAGIHDYLAKKDPHTDFGFPDVRVTHAWTQYPEMTKALCDASRIETAVSDPSEFIGAVDAVLLTRDDEDRHFEFAMPFLEAGLAVFVDKPLSLNVDELKKFKPYLQSGKLMSCSGMRFAHEIDEARQDLSRGKYGEVKLIRGAVVLDWAHYGVHLLDAILYMSTAYPVSVTALAAKHDSMGIAMDDGSLVQIDAMGPIVKNFRIDIYGTEKDSSHQLFDNFTAFRRTLANFIAMIKTGTPSIDPELTFTSMKVLMAGIDSQRQKRTVNLDEFEL
jgi:predicted dehydrogenase